MPATTTQARDDMLARLKATIEASDYSDLTIIYDDKKTPPPREESEESAKMTWCRARIQHTTGRQASISGGLGKSRFERLGFVIVSLFTPSNLGQTSADELVDIILEGFKASTTHGVWFRNHRSVEIGHTGPWFRTDIFVDFLYDQIR